MTACVVRLLADTAVDMGNPTPGERNQRQTFDFHFRIKHFFFSLKMGRVSSEQPARLVSVVFSLIYTIWVIVNAVARCVYLWLVPSVEGVFSEWFTMVTTCDTLQLAEWVPCENPVLFERFISKCCCCWPTDGCNISQG